MTSFTSEPTHVTELRRQLSRWVAEKMPREKRREWDKAHTWDRALFRDLAGMGLIGLTIPEEYGGQGEDIYAAAAVIEELCQGGPSMAGPFIHAAFYGGLNISENGSPEQKEALLPKLARGEMFLCYGLSEPNVGGDLPSVETRVTREGDEIVINGAKRWCTGADWSDYIYCLCRSGGPEDRHGNLTFVLVPTSAPGVSMQPIAHANLRYTDSMDVFLDDVRLPASAIVGGPDKWNKGWEALAGRALDVEKIEITAVAYGIARAALEEAWQYAQERTQFGKPISKHQAIAHKLVTARTKLAACRHMLYHAAWLASEHQPCSVETAMAKLYVADTGVEIGLACQQVIGAYGLSDAYDIERNVRDLLGMPIVGGSSDIQKNNLARMLRL
ncbi:acyl-CoA dehydrogenase family protein [Hyphomonas sp.]|uniref:acyl-CoA dehydrogenase family protein n=1 Tax=Hyphomonas sp. TaxID=87 RepID=UPI003D2D6BBC|tara:strand:+ start:9790 stop:10950 length:1161 start_codon:yes stop_codon:yes gene_type:complete